MDSTGAIARRNLKRAPRFIVGTFLQRKLPHKKIGLADALTAYFGV
jgi:hypothetical protein